MISLREESGGRSPFVDEIQKIFSPEGRLSGASNYEYRA